MRSNRLVNEKSPYLLQHAHNPVDWYPWGEEAFEKARLEDKPIFLSVGYSTCHWCHVMERESFESPEIAEILNRYFVPVKVDREERPDVDRIYMAFVQATTGSGGWPMSVWLTPELKPFYGGTYFPPDNRYGRPGFRTVLEHVAAAWAHNRSRILESSADILHQLDRMLETRSPGVVDPAAVHSCFYALRRAYDARYGGFGSAPKFPRPSQFHFLLRYYKQFGQTEALEMTVATLRAMHQGGVYDQLGGGFHRYSVDARWFVPHFEKMLYDQAQLAVSYLEAFQLTRDPELATVARETLDYVLRELADPSGGFYSAEDADSVIDPAQPDVKGEGAYYIWSAEQIKTLLPAPESEWFCYRFGVHPAGNVDEDPHGEFTSRNILYQAHTIQETAAQFGLQESEVERALSDARARLMEHRAVRPKPHLDDKVLTCWNGLMISAFAKAAQVWGEARYLKAAQHAAEFVLTHLYDPRSGRLLRRYRSGEAAIDAFLDDYAFFVQGLLDLYEADFNLRHIEVALALTHKMRELFEDGAHGGFFSTTAGDSSLVLRLKDDYDGAEPSANTIAIWNLLRLSEFLSDASLREAAERALRAFSAKLAAAPLSLPQMLGAYLFHISKPRQVILCGRGDDPTLQELVRERHAHFLPFAVTVRVDDDSQERLSAWLPQLKAIDLSQPAAYVCENYACQLPVSNRSQLAALLE